MEILKATCIIYFILFLYEDWGIKDKFELHAPNKFIGRLVSCNFCLSFWLSLILCFTGWDWYILVCVPPLIHRFK